MNLKGIVQSAVSTAFTVVDTMTAVVHVTHYYDDGYDTTTRQRTQSATHYTVDAILTNYNEREIDGISIMPEDVRVVIKATDVPEIRPDDVMRWQSGNKVKTFATVNVMRDPAEAVWQCQVRQVK